MILILFLNQVFGQDFKNDSIIKDFIINLQNDNVDTILVYENGVVGNMDPFVLIIDDSCIVYGEIQPSYIIWRKNNDDYITKLNSYDCFTYDTVRYDFNTIWDKYFENKQKIYIENIYMPQYIEHGDTISVGLDHYSYSQFMFISSFDTITFEVSDFDLSKLIDEKYKNLNYEKNKRTMRNTIRDLIDNEIGNIEKNNLIKDYWKPIIVGELNNQQVRLIKINGEFVMHHHDNEDEFFLVIKGFLKMDYGDKIVNIQEGEFTIVPKGVKHRPIADIETHLLLFEPETILNTGNIRNELTLDSPEKI